MEENSRLKKIIKRSILILVVVLAIAVIGLIILKYNVEGEQNMPFQLSELLVVSTAEGYQEKESSDKNWDVEVYQTNDIYLDIKKNKNYKDTEVIKSIEIKNITVDENPKIGNISIYIPNSEEQIYKYGDENKINNEIIYEGDTKSDIKNLKIANQGGKIIFRVVNKTGKRYTSNENELKHDGTLLNKVGINNNDIKYKISFDIVINLESEVTFTGNVELELPTGDITTQGITNLNKTETSDVIFKRE